MITEMGDPIGALVFEVDIPETAAVELAEALRGVGAADSYAAEFEQGRLPFQMFAVHSSALSNAKGVGKYVILFAPKLPPGRPPFDMDQFLKDTE